MSRVLVSACIITYNQKNYISDALDGAIKQTLDYQYEIIIGDDCSTDGTSIICEAYSKKYPDLIKYFRNSKNLGMSENVINALSRCNGKYIAICEGDDYWIDPKKLQKQVDFLESHAEYSFCFHNTKVEENNSEKLNYYSNDLNFSDFHFKDIFENNISPPTCSLVFRNDEIILKPFVNEELFCGDILLIALCSNYGKAKYFSETMACRRVTGEGVWTSLSEIDKNIYALKRIEELYKYFVNTENKNSKYIITKKLGYLKNLIKLYLTNNHLKSIKYLIIHNIIAIKYRRGYLKFTVLILKSIFFKK